MNYPCTAIVSDLHANWPALEVAIEDARRRGAERFVCLGDVVGYGARPRDCLDWVMQNCAGEGAGFCLLGNHEEALMNSAEDFNANARAAIEWTREALNGGGDRADSFRYWEFLDGLEPARLENGVMYAHGSPRDPIREYMLPIHIRDKNKMAANFACMDARICFVGHSHVPAIYYEDGRLYRPRDTEGPYDLGDLDTCRAIVNVGSVGQPRDGDTRLSYCLFDGEHLTFCRLPYDVGTAQADIRSVPALPDYLAARLGEGR